MGRKNGKSAWASGIGLYLADKSDPGGEIYICASDRTQAGIIGTSCKRMVRMDPYLSRRFRIYKNELIIPSTDTFIKILSADADTKDGFDPTAVLFDEVHAQPNAELWDAMALGQGARIEPLMIGITTAGKRFDRYGNDTLCYRLYNYGKQLAKGEIEDPTFLFSWWEPTPKVELRKIGGGKVIETELPIDHLDEETWKQGNPGYEDLISKQDLESVSRRTDAASFQTKRCNMWVSKSVTAIPDGVFEGLSLPWSQDEELLVTPEGREVPKDLLRDSVLFLDGSWSGDSTGIMGCTRDGYLFVVTHHEKTQWDGPNWRVPVNRVKDDVMWCFETGKARGILLDPYRWQQTAADLAEEGIPIVEWPTNSLPRIVPAWKDYYAAVMDGELSHDGDPALVRHHDNLVLKIDRHGSRPTKEHATSIRHIDLAICSIGAHANRELEFEKKVQAWVL
jgi:phage terminase large subunit-like protein